MNRRDFLRLQMGGFAAVSAGIMLPQTAAASGAPKKKGGGADFTQVPLITVFTQGRGGKHGTLSVEVGLDAQKNEKVMDMISKSMPRLRDAYSGRLQAYAAGLNPTSLVDLDYITRELQTATDTVLRQKGAKVLLGSVLLA
ncbi:hypothetical protein [Asticcacaulis sp. YBE204]|uniref:hypothetical protein n=1 Tax=Asticcacaulis sp. YBE204 TaxID=1282363 RepID=UPI0004CEE41C|nr:hypothetical protein [Asticcacaulis sp. YBE204]